MRFVRWVLLKHLYYVTNLLVSHCIFSHKLYVHRINKIIVFSFGFVFLHLFIHSEFITTCTCIYTISPSLRTISLCFNVLPMSFFLVFQVFDEIIKWNWKTSYINILNSFIIFFEIITIQGIWKSLGRDLPFHVVYSLISVYSMCSFVRLLLHRSFMFLVFILCSTVI